MRPTSGTSGSSVISAALTGRWTQVGCQPAPAAHLDTAHYRMSEDQCLAH